MRRDMDFVRDLLLEIEGGKRAFETLDNDASLFLTGKASGLSREEASRREGHLDLLRNAGFIEIEMRGGAGVIVVGDITWAGHDFIDSVREPKVWNETKSRAERVGGWAVGLLTDPAKGYAKAKAAELGFPLG